MTKSQAAIRDITRELRDIAGNMPPCRRSFPTPWHRSSATIATEPKKKTREHLLDGFRSCRSGRRRTTSLAARVAGGVPRCYQAATARRIPSHLSGFTDPEAPPRRSRRGDMIPKPASIRRPW
jgi:hypothetical protein